MIGSTGQERAVANADRKWSVRHGAHLLALWGFAVLQPTLDLLSQSEEFFVARRVAGSAFIGVLVLFAIVPPALLLLAEALAGLVNACARHWVHLFFVWVLVALFALYTLNRVMPTGGLILIAASWAIALGAVIGYVRLQPVRSLLTALSPAAAVFLALFLLFSPASALVFPAAAPVAAAAPVSQAPVVMVIFDELPVSSLMNERGRIDAARFPAFAELARNATWFKNTTTAGDQTEEAVPAILTGARSESREPPTRADHPNNLFTLLGPRYDLNVMEHLTWLCPETYCPNQRSIVARMGSVASAMSLAYVQTVTPARYRPKLPSIGRTWGEVLSPEGPAYRVDAARTEPAELSRHGDAEFHEFLDSIRPASGQERPPLYFLHSVLPHIPWQFLPSGKAYTSLKSQQPGLSANLSTWAADENLVNHGWQRHLLQAQFADRLLGMLLHRLRETGLYDRSLLVVTADHGVSFQPGGYRRAANERNAADVGLVPFFLKQPEQRKGEVVDRSLQSIDVLPTMADTLGIRLPWRPEGRSAFSMEGVGRREVTITRHRGGAVTLPASTLQRDRERTIARQAHLFGSGTGGRGLFGIGPRPDLIGERVANLDAADAGGLAARLDHADDYRSVDLASRYIPALVEARVVGADAGQLTEVAVAINGRVEAVAPTYMSEGETRISVMVPESAFRPGANEVQLLAVSARGTAMPLQRLAESSD